MENTAGAAAGTDAELHAQQQQQQQKQQQQKQQQQQQQQAGKKAVVAGSPTMGDTIHTLCTSNGSPYLNFQNRIMCDPRGGYASLYAVLTPQVAMASRDLPPDLPLVHIGQQVVVRPAVMLRTSTLTLSTSLPCHTEPVDGSSKGQGELPAETRLSLPDFFRRRHSATVLMLKTLHSAGVQVRHVQAGAEDGWRRQAGRLHAHSAPPDAGRPDG